MVAHKILVTSPEAKFLFSLFGAFWGFGLWTGPWPRACQLKTNTKLLIIYSAVDQKFSFDLINQWMIKVLTIMCFVLQETGSRMPSSAGARQRDRARLRRPSSGQGGGIKNPEFKRVREDL